MSLPTVSVNIDYDRQRELVREFFAEYSPAPLDNGLDDAMTVDDHRTAVPKYMNLFQQIANRETETCTLDLDDLQEYEQRGKSNGVKSLVECITENTAHYIDLISEVIDGMLPESTTSLSYRDEVLDVILHHRLQRNMMIQEESQREANDLTSAQPQEFAEEIFPPELTRRYSLYIKPVSQTAQTAQTAQTQSTQSSSNGKSSANLKRRTGSEVLAVRQVKSEHLGQLITVRGVVTRISEVKPAVSVSAYTCDRCGNEVFQEVKSRQFTPLIECPSPECIANRTKGQLFPSTRASKFLPFQEIRLQEVADQVPVGHIPRSLGLHLKGPLVRSVKPGDSVDISGVYMPRPYTGFKGMKAGLITDSYLDVQFVHNLKEQFDTLNGEMNQLDQQLNAQLTKEMEELRQLPNVYDRLASSIAPEIYGHLDVKKSLLLMLIGGVTKEVGDGMKIRGNLNMCLMGDPGVAKSQLLKFIVKLSPRGIFTTGRGSSGVGLTAAVMRDPVTDEMILEGGALVLADNGICCIDEFDKMDESDRTAIHEVMEQQTISIAKAGMSTTLNARTSILAAANPVYGRYNPKLSPVENINLPAALLSRFDILFLMLDHPSVERDKMLAEHVAYVHKYNKPPQAEDACSIDLLRRYISEARTYKPIFTQPVADFLTGSYVQMRQRHKREIENGKQFGYTTPRALLGIMRMAQALARLRFADVVSQEDVDEALRLLEVSKQSLQTEVVFQSRDSLVSKVYRIIVDLFSTFGSNSIPMREVRERVAHKGFTLDEMNKTLSQYIEMGLLLLTDDDQLEKL